MKSIDRRVTLRWEGRGESPDRLAKATAPGEPIHAEPNGSTLFFGDNLATLRALKRTHEGRVTLAYLDPPFLTGRVHEAISKEAGVRATRAAFDDRWADRAAYLESIGARLEAVRDLLAPHGSVVLHVDPKTSHYLKVLCDEIFGDDAFASEIVWRYRRWPAKTPNFQRVHDVLLRYRKDPTVAPRFNPLYEPLAPSTLATWGTGKQRAVFKEGKRLRSQTTKEVTPGVPMGDVWDIGVIAPVSKERTGYPSQKPEALLERIVGALSDPDEWVLDPYAGSGTTVAVAARMGRRFLGIDASPVAIETLLGRFARLARGGAGVAARLA